MTGAATWSPRRVFHRVVDGGDSPREITRLRRDWLRACLAHSILCSLMASPARISQCVTSSFPHNSLLAMSLLDSLE